MMLYCVVKYERQDIVFMLSEMYVFMKIRNFECFLGMVYYDDNMNFRNKYVICK